MLLLRWNYRKRAILCENLAYQTFRAPYSATSLCSASLRQNPVIRTVFHQNKVKWRKLEVTAWKFRRFYPSEYKLGLPWRASICSQGMHIHECTFVHNPVAHVPGFFNASRGVRAHEWSCSDNGVCSTTKDRASVGAKVRGADKARTGFTVDVAVWGNRGVTWGQNLDGLQREWSGVQLFEA